MLRIARGAWAAMAAHAESAYPEECCGAMLGDSDYAALAVALPNEEPGDRTRRYLIHPETLLLRTASHRDRGLKLIGFYHSHPDRAVYFSEADHRECWRGYYYIVLAVREGRCDGGGCWRAAQESVTVEELVVEA